MKSYRLFPIFLFLFSAFLLNAQYVEYGEAAWYSDKLQGKMTSSGEKYDKNKLTAAHRNLPVGSIVRVTRIDNNSAVNVRINDCTKAKGDRIIELSRAAAEEVGLVRSGVARVRLELITLGQGKPACGKTDPTIPTSYNYTGTMTPRGPTPAAYNEQGQPQQVITPYLPDGAYRPAALRPYTSGYAVQVASFSKYENAMGKVAELEDKGFRDLLINFDDNSTYKVLLGPFDTESQANSYQDNLRKNYKIKGFVVSLSTLNAPR